MSPETFQAELRKKPSDDRVELLIQLNVDLPGDLFADSRTRSDRMSAMKAFFEREKQPFLDVLRKLDGVEIVDEMPGGRQIVVVAGVAEMSRAIDALMRRAPDHFTVVPNEAVFQIAGE